MNVFNNASSQVSGLGSSLGSWFKKEGQTEAQTEDLQDTDKTEAPLVPAVAPRVYALQVLGSTCQQFRARLLPVPRLLPSAFSKAGASVKEAGSKIKETVQKNDRRNFVCQPPAGVNFEFELESFLPVAQATLAQDPNLENMPAQLLPKTFRSIDEAWRRPKGRPKAPGWAS
ncbi:Synapse-associated protein [Chionoecetes opilio]|uniref:Synapse-associated protein n=1 Tax=Chionoecetes opilio TaxID=41210 RepID=A0A8J4YD91_CHIOP|nr:Synapse-associated protein [Chionoecetes opilio]